MQWSDFDSFTIWFRNYCHFALELDSPVLESLAITEPLIAEISHERTRYSLQRSGRTHCLWGPAHSQATATGGMMILWKKQGLFDRANGPAIECRTERCDVEYPGHPQGCLQAKLGSKYWLMAGKLHRLGAPAIEQPDGNGEWWYNGRLTKTIVQDEVEIYWLFHPPKRAEDYLVQPPFRWGDYVIGRTDGPAFIGLGYEGWYDKGMAHRLDGPAFNKPGGPEWWWYGVQIPEKEHKRRRARDSNESKRQKIDNSTS